MVFVFPSTDSHRDTSWPRASSTSYRYQSGLSEEVSLDTAIVPPVAPTPGTGDPTRYEDWWERQVTAGRAFRVPAEVIRTRGSYTHFWVPSGPESFLFRNTDSDLAMWRGGLLVSTAGYASYVEDSNTGSVAHPDLLMWSWFGLPNVSGFRVTAEYIHHMESVPDDRAAGIVPSALGITSRAAQDKIVEGLAQVSVLEAATGGQSVLHSPGASVTRGLAMLDRSWTSDLTSRVVAAGKGALAGYATTKSVYGGAAGLLAGLLMPTATSSVAAASFGAVPSLMPSRSPAGRLILDG